MYVVMLVGCDHVVVDLGCADLSSQPVYPKYGFVFLSFVVFVIALRKSLTFAVLCAVQTFGN